MRGWASGWRDSNDCFAAMKRVIYFSLQCYRSAHARSAVGYFAANVFAALVPFLLLPILTRAMTPAAFGQYSLFQMVVSAAMPLVTLTLSAIIVREYALRAPGDFARVFTTCAGLMGLAFMAMSALCFLFQRTIEEAAHLTLPWVMLALVCAAVQGVLASMQGISTMQKRPKIYIRWRAGFALAGGVAAYAAVVMLKGGWQALILSQALASALALGIAAWVSARNRWLGGAFDKAEAKMALRYSLPLVAHALTAGVILQTADRFFVAQYMGLAEVGSYNVAQQVAMTMYVVVNSINLAWQPWYYEQMQKNNGEARRRIVRWTYAGFGFLAALGLCAVAALWLIFPYFVGADFQDARTVFPWLVLGFVVNGMYVLVAAGMFYTGHTLQLMLCNLVTAAANITLNMLLVPRYGMMGAASSTLLSTVCMLVVVWLMTARIHRLPWLLRAA